MAWALKNSSMCDTFRHSVKYKIQNTKYKIQNTLDDWEQPDHYGIEYSFSLSEMLHKDKDKDKDRAGTGCYQLQFTTSILQPILP